jgi:hypothetical protein
LYIFRGPDPFICPIASLFEDVFFCPIASLFEDPKVVLRLAFSEHIVEPARR